MTQQTANDFMYPEIEPYKTGILKTDPPHEIYWETSGNKKGLPVMVLHGGPGGGSSPGVRRFFDPVHYNIIQFDQRGCGQSTPVGCLENNTTADLITDINKLADHLNISQFHIFGGSWGSTLALAYAQSYPERCLSLTLRGIFMLRQCEITWFMENMAAFYPEAYEAFAAVFPETPKKDLLKAFYAALTGKDKNLKYRAAVAWSRFEASCCSLFQDQELIDSCNDPHAAYPISLLEAHYFLYNRFDPDDALLRNVDRIRHIPTRIVQGRYDIICPPRSAWELKQAWPEAELTIIPDAGHSSREPGIAKALIEATEHFKVL